MSPKTTFNININTTQINHAVCFSTDFRLFCSRLPGCVLQCECFCLCEEIKMKSKIREGCDEALSVIKPPNLNLTPWGCVNFCTEQHSSLWKDSVLCGDDDQVPKLQIHTRGSADSAGGAWLSARHSTTSSSRPCARALYGVARSAIFLNFFRK